MLTLSTHDHVQRVCLIFALHGFSQFQRCFQYFVLVLKPEYNSSTILEYSYSISIVIKVLVFVLVLVLSVLAQTWTQFAYKLFYTPLIYFI